MEDDLENMMKFNQKLNLVLEATDLGMYGFVEPSISITPQIRIVFKHLTEKFKAAEQTIFQLLQSGEERGEPGEYRKLMEVMAGLRTQWNKLSRIVLGEDISPDRHTLVSKLKEIQAIFQAVHDKVLLAVGEHQSVGYGSDERAKVLQNAMLITSDTVSFINMFIEKFQTQSDPIVRDTIHSLGRESERIGAELDA
jgi:hypothetical protein